MKNLFLLLTLVGLTFFSCKEKESVEPTTTTHELDGTWNLISVTCECPPVLLESGEHQWTFDIANSSLEVVNNASEEFHTIPDEGSYTIEINTETQKLIFLEVEYDYTFENDKLFVSDHPEVDGPMIEFIR